MGREQNIIIKQRTKHLRGDGLFKKKKNESRADSISTVFNAGIPTAPFDCSLLKSLMFL